MSVISVLRYGSIGYCYFESLCAAQSIGIPDFTLCVLSVSHLFRQTGVTRQLLFFFGETDETDAARRVRVYNERKGLVDAKPDTAECKSDSKKVGTYFKNLRHGISI